MPFNNRTPESLLARSDSKNPATTCRGITTAGKPCRRAITAARGLLEPGVVSIISNGDGPVGTSFYCWQHKEQAIENCPASDLKDHGLHRRLVSVTERTSMDSLVGRLGVMQIAQDKRQKPRPHVEQSQPPLPHPAASKDTEYGTTPSRRHEMVYRPQQPPRPSIAPERVNELDLLCCFSGGSRDEPYYEIVRHRHPPQQPMREIHGRPQPSSMALPRPPEAAHVTASRPSRKPVTDTRLPLASLPLNLVNQPLQPSPTRHFLSYIPDHLSPETTALLLSELSKPISPHDEAGYIYIFWLTDSAHKPDATTASSLLAHRRSIPDITSRFTAPSAASKPTILLKIGRASNVHRRMTEWTQQCGHALSLVRWYPYVPASPRASPQRPRLGMPRPASEDGVRKVPHAHRVERLVHLELAGKRVKRRCGACGKEHREWFEVEASEGGVGAVDETVRRWITWAERNG